MAFLSAIENFIDSEKAQKHNLERFSLRLQKKQSNILFNALDLCLSDDLLLKYTKKIIRIQAKIYTINTSQTK